MPARKNTANGRIHLQDFIQLSVSLKALDNLHFALIDGEACHCENRAATSRPWWEPPALVYEG